MSTFSPAIAYSTEITQVSTGNIPFGNSVTVVMFTNDTDTKQLAYFQANTARVTSVGGTGAELLPTFILQVFNPTNSTWYSISGGELTTTFQTYPTVGTTHEIAPVAVADGNIVTPLKIQVPYNHRILGNFSNPGSNSGTWDIYGLVEKYKST